MITITIDNIKILVDKRNNIFQICEFLKKEIPRFCYHKELMVAGNCRMCLVEVERMPKPVASCAMPLADNMVIYTNSPLVRKARESVLEFLLINHPLDCPICDQGGECDLQDQSFQYGSDTSRFFYKNKRAVEDKNMGVLIKTVMTRCIHCTRCVRFSDEIAGMGSLGTTGRGTHTEIGFYVKKLFNSELSGNVIDLCPVGALTSKPYAFLARPWELTSFKSIDLNDALGANIKIDVCNNTVVRITPQDCWEINDSWISDKARFNFDGLKYQKINNMYFHSQKQNNVVGLQFLTFLSAILKNKKYKAFKFNFVLGETTSLNVIEKFQNLSYLLGQGNIETTANNNINTDFESNYLFNDKLTSFEEADLVLIISSNLRYEAPNLNIKIKKNTNFSNPSIYYIGTYFKNTYDMQHLGVSLDVLHKIVQGKHKLSRLFLKAKNPKIIVGSANNLTTNLNNIQLMLNFINNKVNKNIVNFLSLSASSIGAMHLGVNNYKPKKSKLITYLLDVNKEHLPLENEVKKSLVSLNQSHQGNLYADLSDILIPNSSVFEKKETFLNLQGTSQTTTRVIFNKESYFNEKNFLSLFFNYLLKNNLVVSLNTPKILFKKQLFTKTKNTLLNLNNSCSKKISSEATILDYSVKNFYNTNNISKFSPIMQKTSKQVLNHKNLI